MLRCHLTVTCAFGSRPGPAGQVKRGADNSYSDAGTAPFTLPHTAYLRFSALPASNPRSGGPVEEVNVAAPIW